MPLPSTTCAEPVYWVFLKQLLINFSVIERKRALTLVIKFLQFSDMAILCLY